MTNPPSTAATPWPQAMATVTACTYDAGIGQALAFGIPTSRHFRIAFNYWANDQLHTGEFASAKAIPQNTLFPITYNPDSPHEHSQNSHASTPRTPLLAIAIIGSLILSTAWLILLRTCH